MNGTSDTTPPGTCWVAAKRRFGWTWTAWTDGADGRQIGSGRALTEEGACRAALRACHRVVAATEPEGERST